MAVLNAHRAFASPRRLLRLGPVLLLFFVSWGAARAQMPPQEYQLKAVFLFNFVQFVDWPSQAFSQPQSPLVIGVLGSNPFDSYLDEVVRGEKVNGHPVMVQHYRRPEEIGPCHILFISRSEEWHLPRVLSLLKGRSILTVGDMNEFARRGGMIRLVTRQNKIRLQINVDAARAAALVISSKLLSPAEIVSPENS